jgi:DNA-binding beta-propeller fold protein YncE
LVIVGQYAYVADGYSGLQIIDILDPTSPWIVGGADTPDDAKGVAVQDGYAYVADDNRGLQVIDVTNPAAPVLVGSIEPPGEAGGVGVAGPHAYIANGGSGLCVVDVSDPTSPVVVGNVATTGWAYGVAVTDGHAFVADFDWGLHIFSEQCDAGSGITPLTASVVGITFHPPFPNPAHEKVRLALELHSATYILVRICDAGGGSIRRLWDGPLGPGMHAMTWDRRDNRSRLVTGGSYFIQLDAGREIATRKVVVHP